MQRLAGNAAVTALLGDSRRTHDSGGGEDQRNDSVTVQRQLDPGRYRLNTEGTLRSDAPDHPALASLQQGTKVNVLDKGSKVSLFKAGWFRTNEHSWSEGPGDQTGWIDDSKLDHSLTDELSETFALGAKPNLSQLQAIIKKASPIDKKRAAEDNAFLASAKKSLDEDTYLGLLPALGVYRRPTTPQLSGGGAAHATGPEADRAIRQHLQQYVANAVKAGRKVEGEVSVVGDEDFQAAFERQWVHAAGQTQYEGQDAKTICNAFVDVNLPGRHIWVHRDMGNTGTVIHEGMHKYADPTLRDDQIDLCRREGIDYGGISQLDEGITEYFTRKVAAQLKLAPRGNYQNPFLVASKLVARFSEPVVAAAYYDGKFDALKGALSRVSDWAAFARAIEETDWRWLSSNGYM